MTISKRNHTVRKLSLTNPTGLTPPSSNNSIKVSFEVPTWLIAAIGIGIVISISATVGLKLELSINGAANTQTQVEAAPISPN